MGVCSFARQNAGSSSPKGGDGLGQFTAEAVAQFALQHLADSTARQAVEDIAPVGALGHAFLPLAELGIMASAVDPFDPMEKAFHLLDAPVSRVTAPDVPVPFAPELEAAYRPNAEKIAQALVELIEY